MHSPERVHKEQVWQELNDNLFPNRTGFQTREPVKGERNVDLIEDGYPQLALKTYQSGWMGRLMSPQLDWFTFQVGDEDLMDQRDTRLWTSKAVQACKTLLASSHFYGQMFEFMGDAGAFGTPTLYRYWNAANQREVFLLQHLREMYFAENDDDEIDTAYRYCMMTAKKIMEKFGKDGNVHEEVLRAAMDPDQRYTEYKVLHAVEPNPKYDPRRKDNAAKRYRSWYIDVDHEYEMRKGGYAVMPYATWPVEKEPDEVYGRGPGWRALADIKGLYAYVRTDVTAAQMMVDPPRNAPEEMRDKVAWVPGGTMYFEDAGRVVKAVEHGIELRPGLDREERKQRIIDKHFLVPEFTMMQRLGDTRSDKVTLGHVARIEEEIAVHLGPSVGAFNQKVMDPIMDGVFQDAWDAGMIPPPPRALVESGQRLETVYLGPLAMAAKRYSQQEPYRRALGNMAAIIQMDPTGGTIKVLDNYDLDRISREMSKTDGLPEENLLEERVRDRLRKARAEAAQKQQQMEAMETMGKPGMTKTVEPGSILDAMGKAKQATGAAT